MAESRTLIMIRGLPGSGKSTFAGLISEDGKYPVFCIDDYFTNPDTGTYQFDFNNNFKAYHLCETNTENCMRQKLVRIIVENVFSLEWEMEPYFKLAETYHYRVHILTMENRHGGTNIHDIDEEQIEKMAAKFKLKL